jgi:hypothetical protein
MNIAPGFLLPGIGFLVTLSFGFWLSRLGKPYNGILFNIHKLIALGAVVLTALHIYNWFKVSEPQALLVGLIVIAGMSVAALFASGAFMSIGNLDHKTMKLIHNVAPVLLVVAAGLTFYLFL